MQKISSVKRICIAAICVALCYLLPVVLHPLGLGTLISPMHIPVLLCGLVCGGGLGLLCGILGPVLSSVLSGMPPANMLMSMVPELAVYGLVAGLCMRFIRTKHLSADLYIALSAAMVLGRVVGGIAKAFVYMGGGKAFSFALWISSYFVGTLPGIITHLILIPLLVVTLIKTKCIPARYPKEVSCE